MSVRFTRLDKEVMAQCYFSSFILFLQVQHTFGLSILRRRSGLQNGFWLELLFCFKSNISDGDFFLWTNSDNRECKYKNKLITQYQDVFGDVQ